MGKSATGANRNISYSRESTAGSFPSQNHLWLKKLRTTGDTVKGTQATQTSNELRSGRLESAPIQGRESTSGDISCEWSFGSFDDLFAGLLSNNWSDFTSTTDSDEAYPVYKVEDDPNDESDNAVEAITSSRHAKFLTLATGDNAVEHSFLFERDFTDIEDGLRRYYNGVKINTCSISIPLDNQATVTFGVNGMNNPRALSDAYIDDKIANGTAAEKLLYAHIKERIYDSETPTETDQFSSFIGTLKLLSTDGTVSDVAYATQLDAAITNNQSTDNVILQKKAFSITDNKFGVSGTLTVRLIDPTMINHFIDWTTLKLVFSIQDTSGNRYQCMINSLKITDAPDSVSNSGSLTIAHPFTAFGAHSFDIIKIPAEDAVYQMKAPVAVAVASDSAVSSAVTMFDNFDYDSTYTDPVDSSVTSANRQIWWRCTSQPTGSSLATTFTKLASSGTAITASVAGSYTFEMYAVDASGTLSNSKTAEFICKVTVPTLKAPTASYTSPTITFTSGYTSAPTGWTVHYNLGAAGAAASTIADPTTASTEGTSITLSTAGVYYVKAIAVSTDLTTSEVGTYGPYTLS